MSKYQGSARKNYFHSKEYKNYARDKKIQRDNMCPVCGKEAMTSYLDKDKWIYKHTARMNGTTVTVYHEVGVNK